MADLAWLGSLLQDDEFGSLAARMADSDASVRFVADDDSYALIYAALEAGSLGTGSLVRARHFDVALMLNFDIRRVVVVDSVDEEAARARLLALLREEATPEPILRTMRFDTFVADWMAALAARTWEVDRPDTLDGPAISRDFPSTLYAIVSAPRAGSTFLSSLLYGLKLGRPLEHLRPWLVRLLKDRPPGLFDGIRFIQTLICLGGEDGVFGTKLISHFIEDVLPNLEARERSYLGELIGRFRTIYLMREDKLDQAISSIRARQTGVWHAIDPGSRVRLEPGSLTASHDEVAWEVRQFEVQEEMTAGWVRRLRRRLDINYEELSEAPQTVVSRLCDFLGCEAAELPSSHYAKLADEASQALRVAYLSAAGPDAAPRGTAAQALAKAEQAARAQAEDMQRRSQAIREGHATSKAGDYQDRHYYLLDYRSTHIPGLVFPCRGPVPHDVDAGGYLAFLGAAQTFGAFVHRPFPEQVGGAFGREVLNMGRGGGGPSFFTALPRVMDLVGRAGAVVVQVMAARMISNSRFESLEGRAAVRYREADGGLTVMDCDQAWARALQEYGRDGVMALIEESRRNWVDHMLQIAKAARGPTVLLYFGMRDPDYQIAFRDVWTLYGEYPQMVTRDMVEAVRPGYSAFVEVVSVAGLPEPTVSSFSGEHLPVVFGGGRLDEQNVLNVNAYYPSQAMNDLAARAVIDALGPLLADRDGSRSSSVA